MSSVLQKLQLQSNPFEPAATGAPLFGGLSLPAAQQQRLLHLLDVNQMGEGAKAIIIVGADGMGKTSLLQWLHREVLPQRCVQSYCFNNPGIQFYHLANQLLRTIGRRNLAKLIWELAASQAVGSCQSSLFERGFAQYLSNFSPGHRQEGIAEALPQALLRTKVTEDERIACHLARIVTEIIKKPYFEYRDFVAGPSPSIVAEDEEAPFLRAILKTVAKGTGVNTVALLIDEFEEISLRPRLTRRQTHDFRATMKRLTNLAQSEQVDFRIVLAMTPDAYATARALEPALYQRLEDRVMHIEPLPEQEARVLVKTRLRAVRREEPEDAPESLFPFPESLPFPPAILSNPRALVKSCYRAISRADEHTALPFTPEYLLRMATELYPSRFSSGSASHDQ